METQQTRYVTETITIIAVTCFIAIVLTKGIACQKTVAIEADILHSDKRYAHPHTGCPECNSHYMELGRALGSYERDYSDE